jgi:choline dehydrogenase-like flavoprotein
LTSDLCIVGGGLEALAMAVEWSRDEKRSVLLLAETSGDEWKTGRDSEIKPDSPLAYAEVDGHLRGWVRPFDPRDFKAREGNAHGGWPIDYGDFSPYLDRACKHLGLSSFDYKLEDLFDENDFPMFFHRSAVEANTIHASALHFVDRGRALRQARDLLAKSRNVTVCLSSVALELQTVRGGGRVRALRAGSASGIRFAVEATVFALASGGIDSARLLLNSKVAAGPGLGNKNDLVGRFLMRHPRLEAARGWLWFDSGALWGFEASLKHRSRPSPVRGCLVPSEFFRDEMGAPNFSAQWERLGSDESVSDPVGIALRESARRFDLREWETAALWRLNFQCEHHPHPDSRVRLGSERDAFGYPVALADWRLQRRDWDGVARSTLEISRQVAFQGRGRLRTRLTPVGEWPQTLSAGDSAMGTARMAATDAHGVVDRNCRVFECTNLYVAGTPVFVTSGATDAGLNSVAMSLRLSDHLKKNIVGTLS